MELEKLYKTLKSMDNINVVLANAYVSGLLDGQNGLTVQDKKVS